MNEKDFKTFVTAAGRDGTWDWDVSSDTMIFDDSWKQLFGYDTEKIGDDPAEWFDRIHPKDIEKVKSDIDSHLNGDTPYFASDHRIRDKNGNYRWVFSRGLAVNQDDGSQRFAGMMTDFSESKIANEQLKKEAFYDSLTGIPNRTVFKDRLGRNLERIKRRNDYMFSVMYLDLDRFKAVNDGMGHDVGDDLLIEVGERIGDCLRQTDSVARLGGDEFGVLLEDINNVSDAIKVASRIEKVLTEPFVIRGEEIFTGVSIGIALSTKGYDTVDSMLRDADLAMYRAKSEEGSGHEIFDKDMHVQAVQRVDMENKLRHAVENDEFNVHYQPIFDLQAQELRGFEALVRWQHPDAGQVSPGEFIPLAEETGLIVDIDHLVMSEACRQLREWQREWPAAESATISINLSRKQFAESEVVDFIKKTLEQTGLPPEYVRVEVTESQIMQDTETALKILKQLQDLNILLHMDDFGKGYSSLSYLVRFHVDTLKIDGSFVSNMHKKGENFEIVRMVISLAHNLGMEVIAEGIETRRQLEELQKLQCEFGQGYYLSYPLSSEEIEEFLEKESGLEAFPARG